MRKIYLFFALATTILLLVSAGLYFLFRFTPKYPILHLDKGWTVTYRNEKYVNTNLEHLSNQVGTTFEKGDVITLSLAKPLEFTEVPFPYIIFKTQYAAIELYLDNELVAQKHKDLAGNNQFIGIGYNVISLPSDFSGKKLTIKLFITENNTKTNLLTPIIGNFDDIYRYVFNAVLYPAIIGMFLIVFGFVFFIISLIFYIRTSGVSNQIVCSMLSTSLGLWMLSAYNILDFILSPSFTTTLAFIAMYSFVPLMYLLMIQLHKRYNNTVITFLGYASVAFDALFCVLHFINRVHINHFQKPYFFLSMIGFILMFFYDLSDVKNHIKNSSTQVLMTGLSVLAASLIMYAFVAIFNDYVDYSQNILLKLVIPTGSIFFVVTQLLNHFIFMTRSFAQRKEYASLTQIAYVDNLTTLPNRASCDQKLDELSDSNSDYCILSLDLNGLKEVNDNSGHPAGDRLLKSFSACLMEVFEDVGSCFRIGGDEFLVLFKQIDSSELDARLKTLNEKLAELDKVDTEANHSVSYGYAYRSETQEKDTHSVVMLADKRMYEYKRKFYSHMMKR